MGSVRFWEAIISPTPKTPLKLLWNGNHRGADTSEGLRFFFVNIGWCHGILQGERVPRKNTWNSKLKLVLTRWNDDKSMINPLWPHDWPERSYWRIMSGFKEARTSRQLAIILCLKTETLAQVVLFIKRKEIQLAIWYWESHFFVFSFMFFFTLQATTISIHIVPLEKENHLDWKVQTGRYVRSHEGIYFNCFEPLNRVLGCPWIITPI